MDDVINNLLKLCHSRHNGQEDMSTFQKFVSELSTEKVESLIKDRLSCADGPQVVHALLLGLAQSKTCQKKRFKMMELLMAEMQSQDVPPRNVSTIVTWLVVELEKLSTTHLVKICDNCVNHVGSSKEPSKTCWSNILPKVLNLISNKKLIEHYGSEKTGEAYKKQVIAALCQAEWHPSILTSLASMFIYVPMSAEEHQAVVSRLCSKLGDLTPSEVPPLVHQLLLLTRTTHAMTLFLSLSRYYHRHLYSADDSLNMIDSTNLETPDAIDSGYRKEVAENASVVLYHIEECAKRSVGCASELLRSARTCSQSPELFLQPFLLIVLLSLSNIALFQTQVMDIIRANIVRAIAEEEKKQESDWMRKILPSECDVEQVLIKIIKSSGSDEESVLGGLVRLSMTLLRWSGRGSSVLVQQKVWTLGRLIAVNMVRKHGQVSSSLLGSLTDAVINRPQVTQFTDCLAELCDTSPLLVSENSGAVGRLLEVLPDLPLHAAFRVIAAVTALTRVSSRLRDNLILILRKSLFIHNENSRKLAVFGFLQLLRRLKIRGFSSLSQNSLQIYTCPSVMTQTLLTVHNSSQSNGLASTASNEGLCLEVINILKRCFMQQASVKTTLYQGMRKILERNPELCIPVMNVLTEHFANYYANDEDVLPPLDFSKTASINNNEPVSQEPIGHLLLAIHNLMRAAKSLSYLEDDEFANNMEKLKSIFSSLIKRFSRSELKHFEFSLDDMNGLKDCVLAEVISVYQSLLVHMISSWEVSCNGSYTQDFLALYRAYRMFVEFAKSLKEKSKKETDGRRGRPASQNKRPSSFVMPETVFDLDNSYKLLSLFLCEELDWCSDEARSELGGKKACRRFSLSVCLQVVSQENLQLTFYRSRSVLNSSIPLARLLLGRCLKRFREFFESDRDSACLGVECFSAVISMITSHFKSQLLTFMEGVCGTGRSLDSMLGEVTKLHLEILGEILEKEEDQDEEDGDLRKLCTDLLASITTLCNHLSITESSITKVTKWVQECVQSRQSSGSAVVRSLVSLLLNLVARTRHDSSLLDNLALHLCDLFGTINSVDVEKSPQTFRLVNNKSKEAVMSQMCAVLHNRLDCIDWVIARLKSEITVISLPHPESAPETRRATVKRKEKDVVQEVAGVVTCCQSLSTCAVGPSFAEPLARLFIHTYSSLSLLAKHFSLRASHANPLYQEARFGKLVRLSASHLSSQIADFILYIEAVDDIDDTRKVTKKLLNQAKKQTVYIPRLVSELENFTKCVTQLSNKCKDPSLSMNMKLTTTRDFRLNTKKLAEVMKRNRDESDDDEENKDEGTESSKSQNNKSSQPTGSQKKKSSQTQKSQGRKSSQRNSSQPPVKKKKLK